jgi:hypothetical protein
LLEHKSHELLDEFTLSLSFFFFEVLSITVHPFGLLFVAVESSCTVYRRRKVFAEGNV